MKRYIPLSVDLCRSWFSSIAVLVVLLSWPMSSAAQRLSIVVQTGDTVAGHTITGNDSELTVPKINRHGQFAYSVGFDGIDQWSVVTSMGDILLGPGQMIDGIETHGVSDEDFAFGINDVGQVAYTEVQGFEGIMLDDLPLVVPGMQIGGVEVDVIGAIDGMSYDIPINDLGHVLFQARYDQGTVGLFTQNERVASVGDQLQFVDNRTAELSAFNNGAIGNSGRIAYSAAFDTGTDQREFSAIVSEGQIIVQPGDFIAGRALDEIGTAIAVDDNDEILFDAWFSDGEHAVFRGDELLGVLPREVSIGSQTFAAPRSVWASKQGEIVYFSNDDQRNLGIFTLDGLVAKTGDIVDGKTISYIHPVGHPTISDRGEIAFMAGFSDGTFGVVLATVPEPASLTLLALAALLGRRRLAARRSN